MFSIAVAVVANMTWSFVCVTSGGGCTACSRVMWSGLEIQLLSNITRNITRQSKWTKKRFVKHLKLLWYWHFSELADTFAPVWLVSVDTVNILSPLHNVTDTNASSGDFVSYLNELLTMFLKCHHRRVRPRCLNIFYSLFVMRTSNTWGEERGG